ncbi:Ubiquitin-conjugating enzyme/RWD-like protein [Cordyceps fumosorosea ARSEF 2679]|uniref:Ubiquitin-conjugating enzyme/RWD-like protein n=1 Tax=Cordyceps fumosorosea (strain ARSEF 2679) TaxID=1081104 RepID=A0A162J7N8_CORFA|nr:Ubiquitin-conjugating enzyme/RWD-like protein [Cordyceps fumosorosea ARSEF 2679]OAA64942.1 Ubiquitin-conjugating enzyme/RWD-like protein [Cordyceps fumosorosea ARSEF 2679]
MGREEQVEEREVLDSIFPEEITDVSETEYRISIALDIPNHPEDEEPPKFLLSVRYPDEYPDVAPGLEIMAAPDGGATEFFDTGDDREHLLASVEETIQENIGMAMIFTIVSALKDAAEQLVQERKDAVARAEQERRDAAEREENKKFQGTPVNPETFLKWREGFLKEMEERRAREEEERLAELKKAKVKEAVKLTGRQLWERGLVGKVDEGDDDDDAPVEEMDKLAVEAA